MCSKDENVSNLKVPNLRDNSLNSVQRFKRCASDRMILVLHKPNCRYGSIDTRKLILDGGMSGLENLFGQHLNQTMI